MDPKKVSDVLSWKPPQDVSEIWSFLGMAGTIGDSSRDSLSYPNL